MDGLSPLASIADNPISREVVLSLLDAALRTGELRYARRLCVSWLTLYPGDLQVKLLNARVYLKETTPDLRLHALPILEEICQLDPEFMEAQELLAETRNIAKSGNHLIAKACAQVLTPDNSRTIGNNGTISSWAKYVREARKALDIVRTGDYRQIEKAEYFIHKALAENPDTPLAAVYHLRLMESKGSMPKLAVRSLAQIYHERWPECLQFQLTLANELMESGESSSAVDMVHHAVSKDITGQVVKRMWGPHHQYASMWPERIIAAPDGQNCPQNIPVPAAIASILGWNQLAGGIAGVDYAQSSDNHTVSSDIKPTKEAIPVSELAYKPHAFASENNPKLSGPAKIVQTELERMADELKRPHLVREDGRFPIYVLFSTRGGIESHYGASTFPLIDTALKKLGGVIHGQKINQEYWGSLLFYADDATYTQPYTLNPATSTDPNQLKQILSNLDLALEKRGERIGAVLIVGGPEIVPFHNLPNPVEDADNDVPSDNPYATRDSNYFISDWPVGRISGGSSTDPSHLLKVIQEIINRYHPVSKRFNWYQLLIQFIQELYRRGLYKKISSFGYTAAVWRRASQSVYRSIGNPDEIMISPPIHACDTPDIAPVVTPQISGNGNHSSCLLLPEARLGYFNLHGVPDGSEWYGQCDPTKPEEGPDFPVAMRPKDIRNSGSAPRLVFTEACYGTNIIGKSIEDAISLKFLASGTQAVIGSTCISYGSLASPLTSADLLGWVFWNLLQEGFTVGESFRRAKIHLTREMNQRQGFLDAEDQKTLISFVLFGDPLAQPFTTKVSPKTTPHLSDSAVPIPTVCEHPTENENEAQVSLETITHLKSIVSQYLPGMNDAKMSFSLEQQASPKICTHCTCGKGCVLSNGKNTPQIKSHRRIVTLSKNFERAKHIHRQFARLTLDEGGNIVKMVVSH